MTPSTDAVCFVNHEACQSLPLVEISNDLLKLWALVYHFWSDINESCSGLRRSKLSEREIAIFFVHGTVDGNGSDAFVDESGDLIYNQADQRRNDHCDALSNSGCDYSRKLIANRLASACVAHAMSASVRRLAAGSFHFTCGHQYENILSTKSSIDSFQLVRPEVL